MATQWTVAETGNKSATKSTVADTVDFVDGFGNNLNSTTCRGRLCHQLGRLCCRYRRHVNEATATRSTFNKVDGVEFNFVVSLYWALDARI